MAHAKQLMSIKVIVLGVFGAIHFLKCQPTTHTVGFQEKSSSGFKNSDEKKRHEGRLRKSTATLVFLNFWVQRVRTQNLNCPGSEHENLDKNKEKWDKSLAQVLGRTLNNAHHNVEICMCASDGL